MKKILFLLITGIIFSCEKQTLDPLDDDPLGFSFYPLAEGQFWIYEVREGHHLIDETIDEDAYQLKLSVIGQEQAEDEVIYTIQVMRRSDPDGEWVGESLYQTYRNEKIAVLNTGSASYIKLSFPIEDERSWDGNALNSTGEDEYVLDSTLRSFNYRNQIYFNTATVIQEFTVDPIQITSDNVALEVYSSGVGMVYKELKKIAYKSCSSLYPECCGTNNSETCFGEIDNGSTYVQWLVDHGVE